MIQPLNIKVDLVTDATVFIGLADYEQIIIGGRGFKLYHAKDPCKLIQIPWEEVDYVLVSAMFKGKWIPRYTIQTKKNGTYTFVSKGPKRVLRVIREYVDPDHMIQSLSLFDAIERGILLTRKKKK